MSLIVDNDYMGSENNLVKMGKNATKMFSVVFENENFEESDRNNFYLWESTNEDVVTFVDYYGVEHYNNVVAVGEGEADVIVRLKGTNECDTIRVVVTPTDPQTVEFYNVLYEESLREYPLGYDIDYDGNELLLSDIVGTDGDIVEKDIYEAVLSAQTLVPSLIAPGVKYSEIRMAAVTRLASALKELGLMLEPPVGKSGPLTYSRSSSTVISLFLIYATMASHISERL